MKIKTATIDGFRGAPAPVELRLAGKSLCVLAENGHGKTTIVDALEFWSVGDVQHYHREGYQLDCVINVDSEAAMVRCETTSHPPMTRTLSNGVASSLRPEGPMAVGATLPPPLPVLRHRTMAEFMDRSPGNKKKVLLELFGLEELGEFRQTLRTARSAADREDRDAKNRVQGEVAAFDLLRTGRELLALAEVLRQEAKLVQPIGSESDLLALKLDSEPVTAEPDRPALVADLARRLEASVDEATGAWNAALRDREIVVAQSVSALIAAGDRALKDWTEDTCPLCQQPRDRNELLAELRRRAGELRDSENRFAVLLQELDNYRDRLDLLLSAIERLLAASPPEGWPEPDKLEEARSQLRQQLSALAGARESRAACPASPTLRLPDLALMEETARRAAEGGHATRALADLVRLQETLRRLRETERRAEAAASVATAMAAVMDIADAEIRNAIEAVIKRIGGVAADFYGRLVANPVYSDIELEYRSEHAGGIEFSLLFDGRHRVSPPQRILSESQLNAMGLALFLSRIKVEPQPWRTIVLDDVVNSFDANHRVGLARLLGEEFGDWQVLLLTHDRVFATLARKLLTTGWRFSEIAAWTPHGGPVLVEGGPREQLRARLAEGRSAIELGGFARVALEQGLSLPLEKLGLEIRHDPLSRYSAYNYLQALRRGLRERTSTLADLPVLARMEAASYLVTLGAHDRPSDQAPSTEDLRHLVEDLAELEEGFVCTSCGDPVWALPLDGGRHHQCRCATLAV